MFFRTRRQALCVVLALVAITPWPTLIMAKEREINESNGDQSNRRLFGERIRGTSRGGAAGAAKTYQEVVPMRRRSPLPTTSQCQFETAGGTVTTFNEGASLGSFSTLEGCNNGDPDDYPCLCSPNSPDQRVCPYCQFTDSLNQTICASNSETVEFVDPVTNELTECTCIVGIETVGGFSVDLNSNCQALVVTPGKLSPTMAPTSSPSAMPTTAPVTSPPSSAMPTTAPPSTRPSLRPTLPQTPVPTPLPPPLLTPFPTLAPHTPVPTPLPTWRPTTFRPIATPQPTPLPTKAPVTPTFIMGRLNKEENGLTLSAGLNSRIVATSGQQVRYNSGQLSPSPFHRNPGGADTFIDVRGNNPGGWVYLSSKDTPSGGIATITFNAAGQILKYETILEGTQANAGGGKTFWNTWVTGEHLDKKEFKLNGRAMQVNPFGLRAAEVIAMTEGGGAWQSFAYDDRNPNDPRFFLSEDYDFGCLRMFTPNPALVNSPDPWQMLVAEGGRTQYLVLQPDATRTSGTFSWSDEIMFARANAAQFYRESSGVDVNGPTLSFVTQSNRTLYQLDLDTKVYKVMSTATGLMEGNPAGIRYVEGKDGTTLLYMTEANGQRSGVHARAQDGSLYTVFEGVSYKSSTSGFAISPDGMHMYATFKEDGILFDITRDDGLSFFDKFSFDTVAVDKIPPVINSESVNVDDTTVMFASVVSMGEATVPLANNDPAEPTNENRAPANENGAWVTSVSVSSNSLSSNSVTVTGEVAVPLANSNNPESVVHEDHHTVVTAANSVFASGEVATAAFANAAEEPPAAANNEARVSGAVPSSNTISVSSNSISSNSITVSGDLTVLANNDPPVAAANGGRETHQP